MKFQVAIIGLIAGSCGVTAFTPPKPFGLEKLAKLPVSEDPTQHSALWRPPMKMVAGGAERAYGDDYYDGKIFLKK